MRFRAAKWIAMSVITTTAFAFASVATEAEACCGFWNCLFGWCGGCAPRCCRPCYPCAPSGCSTGTYYGPVVYNNCSPCGTGCATGGCSTGGCATGNCTVGSTDGNSMIAPKADPDPKFRAKQGTGAPETYMRDQDGLGAAGKLPRTESDTNTNDGAGGASGRGAGFSSPRGDGDEADTDTGSGGSRGSKNKKGPPASRANEEGDEGGESRAPTISIDEKVAWRAAPVRTRAGIKAQPASARLVRLPAYPKSEWIPVDSDSKIAKN